MDAPSRHFAGSQILQKVGKVFDPFIDFTLEEIRSKVPVAVKHDITRKAVVEKATATLQRINSSKLMNLARTKIGKGGMIAAAGIIGWNLAQHTLKSVMMPQPAIPRNYERGYDLIKEQMTDFGSPVNLAKAANKVIQTNKSTVRRGVYTTTRAVRNRNLALSLSDNAIRHHQY